MMFKKGTVVNAGGGGFNGGRGNPGDFCGVDRGAAGHCGGVMATVVAGGNHRREDVTISNSLDLLSYTAAWKKDMENLTTKTLEDSKITSAPTSSDGSTRIGTSVGGGIGFAHDMHHHPMEMDAGSLSSVPAPQGHDPRGVSPVSDEETSSSSSSVSSLSSPSTPPSSASSGTHSVKAIRGSSAQVNGLATAIAPVVPQLSNSFLPIVPTTNIMKRVLSEASTISLDQQHQAQSSDGEVSPGGSKTTADKVNNHSRSHQLSVISSPTSAQNHVPILLPTGTYLLIPNSVASAHQATQVHQPTINPSTAAVPQLPSLMPTTMDFSVSACGDNINQNSSGVNKSTINNTSTAPQQQLKFSQSTSPIPGVDVNSTSSLNQPLPLLEASAASLPRPATIDNSGTSIASSSSSSSNPLVKVAEELRSENEKLRQQLNEKDQKISTLQHRVDTLSKHVDEFRQLPTGKISQIPIPDMLELMQVYGSEVSETVSTPKQSTRIQKASIIRQFRRWNPNFFQYFERKDGKWHPKLGKKGELDRRAQARRRHQQQQQQQMQQQQMQQQQSENKKKGKVMIAPSMPPANTTSTTMLPPSNIASV